MTIVRDLALFCIATACVFLIGVGKKVSLDSRARFLEGQALEAKAARTGEASDLIAAAGAHVGAVQSYVPFCSEGRAALHRLAAIGDELDRRGLSDEARQVRLEGSAAASVLTPFYEPYAAERRQLERSLSREQEADES